MAISSKRLGVFFITFGAITFVLILIWSLQEELNFLSAVIGASYLLVSYPLGIANERPKLVPAFIEDKNGHILPYVKFEGGSLEFTSGAITLLKQL